MVDQVDESPAGDGQASDIAAQPIIDAFGGIRPMAAKLGVPVSTVQGWKQRDTIPAGRIESIVAAGKANDVTLPAMLAKAAASQSPDTAQSPEAVRSQIHDTASPQSSAEAAHRPDEQPGHKPAGPRPPMRFSPPEASPSAPSSPSREQTSLSDQPSAATHGTTPPAKDKGTGGARDQGAATAAVPPVATHLATRGAGGALVLAVIALIVAVLWPILFNRWLGADAQDGSPAALEQRVAALEEASASGAPDEIRQALDQLRTDVESLKALSADGGGIDGAAIQAITARVDALEQASGQGIDSAAAETITQALDSLQQAFDGMSQVVDGLQTRVATIENNVQQLEASGGGAQVDQLKADLASIQETLGQIQGGMAQVTTLANTARQQAVDEATALIDQRAAQLSSQISALAGSDEAAAEHQAFLIALGQLSAQLRTAQGFAAELQALEQVVAESETLGPALGETVTAAFAPLGDATETGIPTLVDLRASFDPMRLAVLRASDAPPEDMLDEIWGEVSGLVTISRVDGAGDGTIDGILFGAEQHLAAGDLAGAVEALEGLDALDGGYAQAAADWVAQAKLRLAADDAVDAVQQAAMASFRPETGLSEPAASSETDASPEAVEGGAQGAGGEATGHGLAPDAGNDDATQ